MGTWQSAINVHCCSIKRDEDDDVLSDSDQGEDKGTKEAGAMCVAHPLSWHSSDSGSAPHALAALPGLDERSLPRSVSHVSHATTIPVMR